MSFVHIPLLDESSLIRNLYSIKTDDFVMILDAY